jgi:hypothetical protein
MEDISKNFTGKMLEDAIYVSNFVSLSTHYETKIKNEESNKYKLIYDEESNCYTVECPHCQLLIQIEKNQINCGIFRHGYLYSKENNILRLIDQIGPHTSKIECDRLKESGKLFGCSNPFKITYIGKDLFIEVCDYI